MAESLFRWLWAMVSDGEGPSKTTIDEVGDSEGPPNMVTDS
jgi:hypothetical protein